MRPRTPSIQRNTPTLSVADPRRLAVRSVAYCRGTETAAAEVRINRSVYGPAGYVVAAWDPRLFQEESALANLREVRALSGSVLASSSVDAGLRVSLFGEAGQALHRWDGRGSRRWMQYDEQLRPLAVFEQAVGGEALCTERLSYGASDQAAAERNQCGQLIRHDDPAGSQRFAEFGLHGTALEQTRHFLNDLTLPDWPGLIADREWLLEPGEGATTRSQVNALGEASRQTDAKGHRQLFSQTLDGQLREVRLQLNGKLTPKTLVSAITYNAHGQTEREVAGNGVITTLEYDAQNGRLTRLSAQPGNDPLQDLRYEYDPVGNVLSIKDAALPIRYFANQRIEPVNCYFYDSLSQLIEALGWEAGGANKGPQFSTFDDPVPRANYRQTYHYDAGGNLLELTHKGPQNHAHRLMSAAHSNRCLPVIEGVEPGEDDFRRGFDGNGNLLKLQPGQALAWDLRNQLGEVRPVVRDSGLDDRERYVYGADGMRLRKVRETLAHARTLVAETRYLPNLELRNYSGTGEVLQVINVQAGRSSVRVLHWESEPPKDMDNDQYRYHLNDNLGSCTLELDEDGEVISQERYHPYGTTAWFAGRGEVEASYRTVRYSGKERDATGLYYYGFRYYVAEWQRWLNPDPAGEIDGMNVFRFVQNSPVMNIDPNGLDSKRARGLWKYAFQSIVEDRDNRNVITIVPGIIGVALFGGAEVFEQVGISLSRGFKGERSLYYLSIDASYEGQIVGGDRPVSLKSASAAGLNAAIGSSGAKWTAFINGGFYNLGQLADANEPPWAAIGTSFIDGGYKQSVTIPSDYVEDYVELRMGNGSFIQTGPVLASEGQAVFTQQHLEEPKFQFDPEMNFPGRLGHSNRPNNRSGISMPSEASSAPRTRLVIGLGRGRNDDSPGFTMPEWAEVMARIDRLNDLPGRSVNLDGGDSSALGVIDQSNVVLMDAGAPGNKKRGTSNFIAFMKKS
jgi:insecticidal toxin complex protein TccC